MLSKVLKYDLKYSYKALLVFYMISIISAVFTRIFFSFDNSFIMSLLGFIASAITVISIINILLNNMIRLWSRLIKNVYSDESYLTHTLPISKITIFNSKLVSAIITLFTSILVILLTLFIAYYTASSFDYLRNVFSFYNMPSLTFVVSIPLVFFLEMIFMIEIGYLGIILGHRKLNQKIIWSIIYSFISYMVTNMIMLAGIFIFGIFNKEIMNLFNTTEMIDVSILKTFIITINIIYIILIIIFYFLSVHFLKKGVNID